MPSLVEVVGPLLRTAFEGMAETPVYWEDQPRPFAGPRTAMKGGIQGTLKIKELPTRQGFDTLRVNTVPVTELRPSGFEFVNEGSQEIIVTLKMWAWSQADEHHPHSITNRIVSKLEQPYNVQRITLVASNVVPIDVLSTNNFDLVEDKRAVPTSIVDMRFRVDPEKILQTGYVIERVGLEGSFMGSVNPSLFETELGQAPLITNWTPEQAERLIVSFESSDDLKAGSVWRDRARGYRLNPKGPGGAADVSAERDHILSGIQSYMATDVQIPTNESRSQYAWAYMAHRTLSDPDIALFLTLFCEDSVLFVIAQTNGMNGVRCTLQNENLNLGYPFVGTQVVDRKVCVGVYVTPTHIRLDVDGVAGPLVAYSSSRARSLLQVGAWGGTGNTAGQWRSECEIYSVGVAEDQDIRSEVFGFVKTKYKGD